MERSVNIRDRHKAMTRDAILDALVAELAEAGVELNYAELARRAGVSIQTIYRHFPRRDDLLDGLGARVGRVLGLREYPRSRPEILAMVRALFARFDEHAALLTALVHACARVRPRAKGRTRRAGAFEEVLAAAAPHAPAERRRALAGLLNTLVSANTWYRLREEHGLDGKQAGDIVAWSVDALWRALPRD